MAGASGNMPMGPDFEKLPGSLGTSWGELEVLRAGRTDGTKIGKCYKLELFFSFFFFSELGYLHSMSTILFSRCSRGQGTLGWMAVWTGVGVCGAG